MERYSRLEFHRHTIQLNGIDVAYYRTNGGGDDHPVLLFLHGLSFHARSWDPTIRELKPELECISVDFRGHGQSQKREPYTNRQLALDIIEFVRELNLSRIVGVGHSLGGLVLLQVAAKLQQEFESLLVLEPTVFDPKTYRNPSKFFTSADEHPYSRARSEWTSPQEWFDRLRSRSPFNTWEHETLWNHCIHGLTLTARGTYELSCPPRVQAAFAVAVANDDVHPLLSLVQVPTVVVRARPPRGIRHPLDDVHSLTWPDLAQGLAIGKDVCLDDATHFIPMEDPNFVSSKIRELLAG